MWLPSLATLPSSVAPSATESCGAVPPSVSEATRMVPAGAPDFQATDARPSPSIAATTSEGSSAAAETASGAPKAPDPTRREASTRPARVHARTASPSAAASSAGRPSMPGAETVWSVGAPTGGVTCTRATSSSGVAPPCLNTMVSLPSSVTTMLASRPFCPAAETGAGADHGAPAFGPEGRSARAMPSKLVPVLRRATTDRPAAVTATCGSP
jgi:hypothetical protein